MSTNGAKGYELPIPNSNGASTDHNPARSGEGTMPSVTLRLNSRLHKHGERRARISGDFIPRPEDVQALKEHAEAAAHEAYREAYDPKQFEHDRLRNELFEKNKKGLEEAEQAVKHASTTVRQCEQKVASLESGRPKPVIPHEMIFIAAFVLAITVAPTMHDFIFISLEDDLFNWGASILSSMFIGLFISYGILGDIDCTGKRNTANISGLSGGIAIGVGLGILRLAQASAFGEVLFAFALTVVEIGIIVVLEWRASSLRDGFREWSVVNSQLTEAQAELRAADTELKRRQEQVQSIEKALDDHIRYVEERWVRRNTIEEIKAAAIKSALDGYDAGLAINRGISLGAKE